ncbi:MAG: hypothetical protein J6A77_05035 [Lachnospiraceae bacterium]|nr:hypothetical protein [Lachnospiraceae bacterium]
MKEHEIFWVEVQKIQDYVVNVFLLKASKYDDMKELLNDVTYETIYGLLELLDGYKNSNLRGEIINKLTGNNIGSGEDFHNYCEEYLKTSEI